MKRPSKSAYTQENDYVGVESDRFNKINISR